MKLTQDEKYKIINECKSYVNEINRLLYMMPKNWQRENSDLLGKLWWLKFNLEHIK